MTMQNTDPSTGFPTGSSSGGSNGGDTLNRATSTAHSAVDRVASSARPVIDRVASSAHKAVDKAASVAVPTADWLSERGQTLKQTQDQLMSDTRQYVTSNPLKAIGMALAAGLLIGRLMR
jgi:ElaB/YqjD/DUF883 family membrane-anchored ribosome-binding protein